MSIEQPEEDPLVRLSVSGTPFTVRSELIINTDWVLSRLVESEIPWKSMDEGRYFVDADPIAFRWALHFAKFNSLPEEMSKSELESLRCLGEFLCFDELLKCLDRINTSQGALEREVIQLRQAIEEVKRHTMKVGEVQRNEIALKRAREEQVRRALESLESRGN